MIRINDSLPSIFFCNFRAATWLLAPADPRRKRLEPLEFYVPETPYFQSSVKQLRAAYKHLHDWISEKITQSSSDPVLAHKQLETNLKKIDRKIKRGKFEKNKGPAAKKMKTSMERSFSEDEYEDEEEFMEPHLTKQLVEAYKVESL